MGRNTTTRRILSVAGAAALAVTMLAVPASATPKDNGDHKVTICHVTNSATNPFVVIEVDVAAFDWEGKNDHAHHVNKDGLVDVTFDNGACAAQPTDPTDPTDPPDQPYDNF